MYFGGIFACPKAKEAIAFLKLRVGIKETETMDEDLDKLGQILDDQIQDETYISFSRNPYSCQAVKVETLGSLFSSCKSMDSEILVRTIKKKLNIPPKVEVGATWRTLKNKKKQQYPWNLEYPPPQAIHLEIDANYAPRYYDAFSELFGTGSEVRILGTQMRLVPCPSSPKGIGLPDNQMTNILIMHAKQQYFTNEHTVRLENNHIRQLDLYAEGPHGKGTLREWIMQQKPKNNDSKRIFVSIDKSWNKSSFVAVVVKEHYQEAINILNRMVPECLKRFGDRAYYWFTNMGIEIYKDVEWDPNTCTTTSKNDTKQALLVDEDIYEMGQDWKKKAEELANSKIPKRRPDEAATATLGISKPRDTRADDSDVRSFRSILRTGKYTHFAPDTKQGKDTAKDKDNVSEMSTSTKDQQETHNEQQDQNDDVSTTSTVNTTESTKIKLHEAQESNQQLLEMNQQLLDNKEQMLQEQEQLWKEMERLRMMVYSSRSTNRNKKQGTL